MVDHYVKAPKIALVKPDTDAIGFDRGERIITVNGVRWGRTHVTHRGRHGYSVFFDLDRVGVITRPGYEGQKEYNWPPVAVYTLKRWEARDDKRTMDERVLAMIEELIEAGELKHPDTVKAEIAATAAQQRKEHAAETVAKEKAFRDKAIEAAKDVQLVPGLKDALVDRIVEAMRWAQTK